MAVEGCTGWRYVVEEIEAAGFEAHVAEPADTQAARGRKHRAKTDRSDAQLLRELPVWCELGDCRRFSRSGQVVRHTGLDVSVDQSDLHRAHGHLTRQGPSTLRWALFEAAHNASRHGSPDHDYYLSVKSRHDGKLAAISVARQFARRCYHLLRNLDPDVVYADAA